jgi:hypothetical protein
MVGLLRSCPALDVHLALVSGCRGRLRWALPDASKQLRRSWCGLGGQTVVSLLQKHQTQMLLLLLSAANTTAQACSQLMLCKVYVTQQWLLLALSCR